MPLEIYSAKMSLVSIAAVQYGTVTSFILEIAIQTSQPPLGTFEVHSRICIYSYVSELRQDLVEKTL